MPANSRIVITFPSSRYSSITNGAIAGWSATPFTVSSWTGSSASKSVTLVLSGPAISFVTLVIPSIVNPSTTTPVSGYGGTLTNTSSGVVLDSLTSSGVLFTPTPKSLTAATISVASGFTNTVGATIDILVAITYSSAIDSGSVVVLSIPKWERSSDGATSPNSCLSSSIACENESTSSSITCSYSIGSGFADDTLTVTGLITSARVSGDTDTIRVKNFINYSQLATYSVSVFVNAASGSTTNSLTGVSMTPTAATTLAQAEVLPFTLTVNSESVYFISVQLNTILPIGAYVRITLPPQVSYTDTSGVDILSAVSMTSALNSPTVVKTGLTATPSYFDLTGIVTSSSNYRTKSQTFFVQMTSLRNPPSVATSGSFTVALYDSSNNRYESSSTGMTVTATAGVLSEGTSPTMSATSTGVLDSVDFTLSLQAATALSTGTTASIVVTFPSEFTLTTGTCSLSDLIGFSSSTCSISGQVVTISNFASDTISAGENFKFTIGSNMIALPSNTATTSTFTIETQASGSKVDSISSLTWSQTTVGTLGLPTTATDATVPSSSTTYTSTTYTFELYPPHVIEQNAVIEITFPTEITLPSSTTCTALQNIETTLSWTISGSVMTVSNGYSASSQSFTGSQALKFTATSITNPRSLQPTGTFAFAIKSSSGSDIYTVTGSTLAVTTASTFSSVAIAQSVGTNGASTSYTWTLTTNSQLVAGDLIKITPPSSIVVASPSCSGVTGLASSLACSMSSGSLFVTVAFARRRQLAPGDPGTYSFMTSGVTNAPSTAPSSTFTVQSMLSDQSYLIEQDSSATVSNSASGTITSASVAADSVALSTAVSYTLTFTPVNYVQGMSFKVTLPIQLSISSGTNTCTNVQGLTDATFNWVYTSASREIVVAGQFAGTTNPGEVSLQIPLITNPSSYGTTSSFVVNTYHTVSGTDYDIDSINTGITADISCATKWLTCSSVASSCLTWDSTSIFKYFLNNDWLSDCPNGFFNNVDQCTSWDSTCNTCSGTATTCTSWVSGLFLHNSEWLTSCPIGFVESGTTWVVESTSTSENLLPFPLLIVYCIILIGVFILKCAKDDTRFLPTSIALTCFVELVAWLYLAYSLYSKDFLMSTAVVVIGLVGVLISNFIFFCIYSCSIRKDKGFKPFKEKNSWWHWMILTTSILFWHRYFRLAYSYIAGADSLGGILTTSLVAMRIISMASICMSSLPVIWACLYNMYSTGTSEQIFWIDAEVAIITALSIILITMELAKLSTYKIPTKERRRTNLNASDQSAQDIASNKSDIDERLLRRNALDRIMKNLDIRNKGESLIGENAFEDREKPRNRLSIQDPKSPYAQDEDIDKDKSRVDSEPAIKHKDYDDNINEVSYRKLLEQIEEERNKNPKVDQSIGPDDGADDTLSQQRRQIEEDFQTDDKPSEEEKKLDLTENIEDFKEQTKDDDGFTQYQNTKLYTPEEKKSNRDSVIYKEEIDEEDDDQDLIKSDIIIAESKKGSVDGLFINHDPDLGSEEEKGGNTQDHKDDTKSQSQPNVNSDEKSKQNTEIEDRPDSRDLTGLKNQDDPVVQDDPVDHDDLVDRNDSDVAESRVEDITQDKILNRNYEDEQDNNDNNDGEVQDEDDEYAERAQQKQHEEEKALDSDDLDNDDTENLDDEGEDEIKRTISEREQPLDEVIQRNDGLVIAQTKSEDGGTKILHASDGRGSKETSNGVLETPPPEEYDDIGADAAAIEMMETENKPRVFYSNKSESSVESMMADTPSNYNIPNGRFDDRTKGIKGLGYGGSMLDGYPLNSHRNKNHFKKPNLDIISEIENPIKAPSNLNNIKHVKTTKNERNFIDSVLGSDKTSYMGDMMAGSVYGKGVDSDRGPGSDHNPIPPSYDLRRQSKSNLRTHLPPKHPSQSNTNHPHLKYNQFMTSNNGSDDNSVREGLRVPRYKPKKQPKKKLKLLEDKNLSLTNVNDLEHAYLSGPSNMNESGKNFKKASDKYSLSFRD